jgi:hypothetical protein
MFDFQQSNLSVWLDISMFNALLTVLYSSSVQRDQHDALSIQVVRNSSDDFNRV